MSIVICYSKIGFITYNLILEEQSVFQDRLDQVGGLLGRLQNVQNQRLSAPLPQHLSQISLPSPQEIQLGNVNVLYH